MRPLRFVALSEDGTHFVLAPDVPDAIDNGERFLLPLDDRLRAAARGDLSRMGQIELEIGAQLRPREIQARIRAGETPDSVAAAAGMRIERVMTYASPVLQERGLIAQRAQSARVKIEDSVAAAPTLSELIESRLLVRGLHDTDIDWDARRLDDGHWEVTSTWRTDEKTVTAHWRYDVQNGIIYPGSKDTIAMVEPKPKLAAVPVPVDDPSVGEADTGPIPLPRASDFDEAPMRPTRRRTPPREIDLEQLLLPEDLDDAIDPGHLGNAGRRPELDDDQLDEPVAFPTTRTERHAAPEDDEPVQLRAAPRAEVSASAAASPVEDAPRRALTDESVAPEPVAQEPVARESVAQRSARHQRVDVPPAPRLDPENPPPSAGATDLDADSTAGAEPSTAKDKKPRIPSWDDIVFGVKKRK